jgi:mRNA interferase MazF
MTRGDVWWAELPLPAGKRPVILVSRESSYAIRSKVTVIEVSTTIRLLPTEVPMGPAEGLPRPCVANADNLVTIPKQWLSSRIATLGPNKLKALDDALRFALDLGE